MKWVEHLIVRGAGKSAEILCTEVVDHVRSVGLLPGLVQVKTYINGSLPDDLKITLIWDTEQFHRWGSTIGRFWASALKEHGLVDHSVWLEKASTP